MANLPYTVTQDLYKLGSGFGKVVAFGKSFGKVVTLWLRVWELGRLLVEWYNHRFDLHFIVLHLVNRSPSR